MNHHNPREKGKPVFPNQLPPLIKFPGVKPRASAAFVITRNPPHLTLFEVLAPAPLF
ncbi:hypothetical protein Hanom_Chr12g01078521 [Helianthus anomalus]